MRIVVLGGAGFTGSAICRFLVAERGATVLNIDRLGPTSSLASLGSIANSPRYAFRRADIRDREHIAALLSAFAPDAIVHAAAETDASIRIGGADAAVDTNLVGTWRLLEAVREHWTSLPEHRRARFRFVSVSSLEAYSSPAAATRTAADELVRGWHASFGLPTVVAQVADAFGPCQFPNAPVPAAVIAALNGETFRREGSEPRHWLFADDYASAIVAVAEKGVAGATYAVAGRGLADATTVAGRIAELVERHAGKRKVRVCGTERPARDAMPGAVATVATPTRAYVEAAERFAVDTGWRAAETLDSALSKTVRWYIANEAWWRPLYAAQAAGNDYGLLRIA